MSVGVTPGVGLTVAADVIGTPAAPSAGQQIQYVKIDTGVAGASAPVSAANPMPVSGSLDVGTFGGQPIGSGIQTRSAQQRSFSFPLQTNAVANGNGSIAVSDGYNGSLQLLVANGSGSCNVSLQGSFDNFGTSQNILPVAVYKLADSLSGPAISAGGRSLISGSGLAVVANTSYVYGIADVYPYYRAPIAGASSLASGTQLVGCSVNLYALPN